MLARLFTAALVFTSAVFAAVPVVKRSDAQIMTALTNLNTTIAPTLAQITALANSGKASDASVLPLISQLNTALNNAHLQIASIPPSKLSKRAANDVADLSAVIVSLIVTALDALEGVAAFIPSLEIFLDEVDIALNALLAGLAVLVAGLIDLLNGLLTDVAIIITELGLTLVGVLLGLL